MTKNKIPEVLILGLPNAGKSTLVNALSKRKTSIIGSTPKKIIRGNLIAPKAIPKSPPKNPISEHSTRRTKYIYIDSSIRN